MAKGTFFSRFVARSVLASALAASAVTTLLPHATVFATPANDPYAAAHGATTPLLLPTSGLAAPGLAPSLLVPSAVPQFLGLGLSAGLDEHGVSGWLGESDPGTWQYVYQYLAGGANTGRGWQSFAEEARYPLHYAKGVTKQGYVPIFTYYQMDGSAGPCAPCDEPQRRNLINLNDPGVMRAYFEDFALLMKRLGSGIHDDIPGFGGPVIVHVEPDLAGFAQQAVLDPNRCFGLCRAQGNDPAFLSSAVSLSGMGDVEGLPDTFQGYNWALLRLRDLHAPNVLLAFHVSSWAGGIDVGSNTDADLDVNALAGRVASFARESGVARTPSGISTFDLLFNDVADKDSGYAATVEKRENAWWDRRNVTLPHFHRWEQYLGTITRATSRPAIVWQIPSGNQVYRTMDNTPGHWQDNRAEYFLAHPNELLDAGVIGLLFAGGDHGTTARYDRVRDGVTNPTPRCTTDGTSSSPVCNDRIAEVADDDGGFLRLAARQYRDAGPVGLAGHPVAPVVVAPAPAEEIRVKLTGAELSAQAVKPGHKVVVTQGMVTSRDVMLLVRFELRDGADRMVWRSVRETDSTSGPEGGQTATANFVVPAGLTPGTYTFKLGVFSPDSRTMYAWNNGAGQLTVGL